MLILLSGYANSGKNQFAEYLIGFKQYALADKLRRYLYKQDPILYYDFVLNSTVTVSEVVNQIGWEKAKRRYPNLRRMLQTTGDAVRNIFGEHVFVSALLDDIYAEDNDFVNNYVISDTRYKDEINNFEECFYNLKVVRINKPGVGPANNHVTEIDLDDYAFDYVIENDGTLEDLKQKAEELLECLV